MSDQNEFEEIKKIDQNLLEIRDKIASQKENIIFLVEKRDKLNKKARELAEEIKQKKFERDKLNITVKNLKEKRFFTHLKIQKKIDAIKKHKRNIELIKLKITKKNYQDLKKEFDDIEWKIQTNSLELDEEKELVKRAKILGTQIGRYNKIKKEKEEIKKLNSDIQNLDKYANKIHIELIKNATKSQEIHLIISLKIDEFKIIKTKANDIHLNYLELIKNIKPLHIKKHELTRRKEELLVHIREKEKRKRKEIEKHLKEKIKSDAKIKIKNKEKLSWDEFKLLTELEHKNNK